MPPSLNPKTNTCAHTCAHTFLTPQSVSCVFFYLLIIDDGHSDRCEVIVAILVGMKLYFIAVLTYISLMASDAEHHFMYLFSHSL